MIPFWKKTDKGGKKPPKPAVPHTAQQSIPMQRMFEDGTCRVKPNYYTRTIAYQDINYQLAQQEDKTAIFEEWCSFLNFFDSSIKFELSFVNMATDSSEFEKSIRIPYQRDGFDDVRAEYSQMLRQQLAKGNNGLTKTKFITFGVEGESMKTVKTRLDHVQNDLLNNFHRLGVQAKPLNGEERLKLMHDMLNMDGESKFRFKWKDLVKSGLSVKDAIAPTAFAFKNSRTFQMGGIYCAASFLSITASDLSDQLLKDFLDMDSSQIVTMHIQSVDQNRAIKTVKRTITELDRSTIEEQKKAIRKRRVWDDPSIPTDDVRLIDSNYKDLYRVPNGGVIQMDYSDGSSYTARVEHLDEYHFDLGGLYNTFHICQFAEIMERNGTSYYPEIQTQDEQGAWKLGGKGYIAIQSCDDGWDYTIYHSDFSVMDGGQLTSPELTIQEVREEILEAHHMEKGQRLIQDYDFIMDKAAEAEELGLNSHPSTLEKLVSLASAKEKCDAPECSPAGCRKVRDAHEL